jgi:hypothetical protein
LSKLGVFILQARKARLKSEKAQKPLILSVKNTEKKRTLVIAVFGPEQANQVNAFGNYFSKTARSLNIAITHDSFDTAIVELKPSDWINFIT